MYLFFHRHSYVQARNTLLLASILAFATGGYQIYSDFCRHRQETAMAIQQVMLMQEESAALAAWSLDTTAAKRVINGLFQYLPVRGAKLVSDNPESLWKIKNQSNQRCSIIRHFIWDIFGFTKEPNCSIASIILGHDQGQNNQE